MRRLAKIACVVVLLGAGLQAGEVIDGIAATVDGRTILTSDVDTEVAYQCLASAEPRCADDAAAKNAARERLIERALVEEQMRHNGYQRAGVEEIARKVAELRGQLPAGENSDAGWRQILEGLGLSDAEVEGRIRAELEMLNFIDSRFRPAVRVEPAAVERYYREQFVPKLPAGSAPELSAVAEQIREILTQQLITTEFDNWLATLRQQSRIEVR